MIIHWIKCSERMPPDDETQIILEYRDNRFERCLAYEVNDCPIERSVNWQWIPYTEETWRRLNDTRN